MNPLAWREASTILSIIIKYTKVERISPKKKSKVIQVFVFVLDLMKGPEKSRKSGPNLKLRSTDQKQQVGRKQSILLQFKNSTKKGVTKWSKVDQFGQLPQWNLVQLQNSIILWLYIILLKQDQSRLQIEIYSTQGI
ncbi:Hypothetical_protein [Hexamita inflata]|uniref:Hypothetical_protein n=1 Tax=Hexamita inflata TaxID=28002 RepID=A0AA86RA51_9EUKA|nr:Hypothetical protein HINF_LOCUS61250 [Hexamita inflata]